jgi:hypothetical protein
LSPDREPTNKDPFAFLDDDFGDDGSDFELMEFRPTTKQKASVHQFEIRAIITKVIIQEGKGVFVRSWMMTLVMMARISN